VVPGGEQEEELHPITQQESSGCTGAERVCYGYAGKRNRIGSRSDRLASKQADDRRSCSEWAAKSRNTCRVSRFQEGYESKRIAGVVAAKSFFFVLRADKTKGAHGNNSAI